MKWIVKDKSPQEFRDKFPELDNIVCDLLYHRGLTEEKEINQFLHPDYVNDLHDPFLFSQMKEAVARIKSAVENNEKITIHGDYDADGLGGSVVLYTTLKHLGVKKVEVYLPDREKEGYGLNKKSVEYIAQQGSKLIITTDCGISNVEEIAHAKSLGLDVIVTDHHAQKDELPDAIILHPKVKGETYPFKELAGGGVAFKFAQGLLKDNGETPENEAFEKWLLDMVAISSVADMVPLIGENRTLVKYGLIVLSKARRPGIKAILTLAGMLPPKSGKELNLNAYHIGFVIGPRLNAAGRLDHANAAFEAIIEEDYNKALQLAESLEKTNKERQELTKKITDEALKEVGMIDPDIPSVAVVQNDSWPMGVVGLIASRVLEKIYRPVFVLGKINGKIAGSGRSIEGFDCTDALADASDLLSKFGGHARACGFTITDNDKLDELKKRFNEFARKNMTKDHLQRVVEIDAELKMNEITWDLYDSLQLFAPFGMGNSKPKFSTSQAEVVEISTVGADNQHLRLTLTHDHQVFRKCIAFKKGEWIDKLHVGAKLDAIYEIEVNEWNGNRELQLLIKDIRV